MLEKRRARHCLHKEWLGREWAPAPHSRQSQDLREEPTREVRDKFITYSLDTRASRDTLQIASPSLATAV